MTESPQDISSSPGKILKAARDELKYSIEHVAHELHLRACVVQAMEDEDYDQFSSDVFLKGYFRSYCRLVHLHEERMVELLDKQLSSRQKDREDAALLEKKINPFLRCNQQEIINSAANFSSKEPANTLETFTHIRQWKNQF